VLLAENGKVKRLRDCLLRLEDQAPVYFSVKASPTFQEQIFDTGSKPIEVAVGDVSLMNRLQTFQTKFKDVLGGLLRHFVFKQRACESAGGL
jgi:hypothetical protein